MSEQVNFPLENKQSEEGPKKKEEEIFPEEDAADSYFIRWIRFFQEASFPSQSPPQPYATMLDNLISQLFPGTIEENRTKYSDLFPGYQNPDEAWKGTTYIASSSINTKDVNGRVRRYLTKGDIEVFDNAENFVHDDDELVDSWKQNMGVDSKRLRLEWAMTFFNMLQILRFSLALRDNQLRVIFDTVDQMKKVVEHQNEAWSNLDPLEALWRGEITCQKQLLYELIASVVHGAEVRPYCKVLNMLCHCRYYHINFLWDTMYADQLFIGLVSPSYVGAFPIRFINIWDNTISSQPFIEFVNRHTKIISGRHSRWSALTIY